MGVAAARGVFLGRRKSKPETHFNAGAVDSVKPFGCTRMAQGVVGEAEKQCAEHVGEVAAAPLVPLAFVGVGNTARIVKLRGGEQMHHHLENLGFVEGSFATVASETSGNLIVEVKGARVALDRQVALKIITSL